MPLQLTDRAAQEIKRIADEQDLALDGTYLRFAAKGGGCSGFSYALDLTDQKGEQDEVFESHDIKLVCDPKSYLYLNGTTLDYKDDLNNRGFVFDNPNASGSCSCGSSFSA
jgi:iron-sulfur cluster assembly accessory protein